MSLIPYHPREGREIVLRHHNAIVVRDPASQRLEIRGLQISECPTCHQPWRSSSPPERHFDGPDHRESYVDPGYFRMLRQGHAVPETPRPPSSPIRRMVEPAQPDAAQDDDAVAEGAEFVSSSPAPQEGSRIRREAFSPNYFNTFFVEERELGRGGKGVVMLVRHEIDGCHLGHFACKRVPVGDDHAWLEKVLVEVELLAKLSHPNLVSYRHVWLEDVKLNRFGPSVACAFILQQYCNGGDLLHYVVGDIPKATTKEELKAQMRRRSKGQLEPPQGLFGNNQRHLSFREIYSLFQDITSGLAYLHASNYIHRDLKPSNCLLHREGNQLACLISDFGEVQAENVARKSTGSTGTISYCAPEVLKKDASGRFGNFTTKSDVFSLGMILYFMCFGRLPYRSANAIHEELEDIDKLRAEIKDWQGFQDERKERPDLPSKLYQLLKKLLSVKPSERPSASEVLLAMKSESSMDGVMRGSIGASPSVGLSGHRIQNLDSPMPSGTPIPDPTKHARVSDEDLPSFHGDSPQPTTQNILQKHTHPIPPPMAPRQRRLSQPQSMALSPRGLDGYSRGGSTSPERGLGRRGSARNTTISSPGPSPATVTTPLLMPPPTTRVEQIRHYAVLWQYRCAHWLQYHAALSGSFLQLLFLGVKLFSVSWFCWPYSSNLGVLASILALAVLDLWNPGSRGSSGGSGNRLRDALNVGVGGSAGHQDAAGASRWLVGWRRSCTLLALHVAILWVTSRFGVLCAVGHQERWSDW
ncbi:kinase-like domain-containing protein [Lasiosphaeria miniovina]|uniref:non-specific serine/threonine protein kinase n=1 Tax=Lasiosphaeria miniovina TaxID=1954250 RepID=A0AA40ABY4_9PEZI|nr:kinase-like domain-containing protein [Lasiosphaeria miniovina]KAK0712858.1 kinase-like domain-containing protein [Lasiosphaeria miniovina]